jgi:hypothetical protein
MTNRRTTSRANAFAPTTSRRAHERRFNQRFRISHTRVLAITNQGSCTTYSQTDSNHAFAPTTNRRFHGPRSNHRFRINVSEPTLSRTNNYEPTLSRTSFEPTILHLARQRSRTNDYEPTLLLYHVLANRFDSRVRTNPEPTLSRTTFQPAIPHQRIRTNALTHQHYEPTLSRTSFEPTILHLARQRSRTNDTERYPRASAFLPTTTDALTNHVRTQRFCMSLASVLAPKLSHQRLRTNAPVPRTRKPIRATRSHQLSRTTFQPTIPHQRTRTNALTHQRLRTALSQNAIQRPASQTDHAPRSPRQQPRTTNHTIPITHDRSRNADHESTPAHYRSKFNTSRNTRSHQRAHERPSHNALTNDLRTTHSHRLAPTFPSHRLFSEPRP